MILTILCLVVAAFLAVCKLSDQAAAARRTVETPRKGSEGRIHHPTRSEKAARAVAPPRILGADDLTEMEEWLNS